MMSSLKALLNLPQTASKRNKKELNKGTVLVMTKPTRYSLMNLQLKRSVESKKDRDVKTEREPKRNGSSGRLREIIARKLTRRL